MSNSRRLTIGQNIDSGESGGGTINTSNYMTILALENGLTASLSSNACQYCIDGDGNWIDLPSGTTTQAINSGQTLSFKGNLTPNPSSGIGTFTISKKCNLEGNCMSLLFGDDAVNNNSLSGKNYAFYRLFRYCTTIIQVSELFLPATTLARSCYYYMFYGCTSLTTAPELAATTLASYCYQYMFYGCTSLTTAPELLATTLSDGCYSNMFNGCTSLTTAPELAATRLASHCYNSMFYGCTSLTVAPELPATTSADRCYYQMFYGCSNLNYIKMLATDIYASNCLYNWVYRVSSTGTFIKNPAMTSLPTGTSGIPSGWTVVDNTGLQFPVYFNLTKISDEEYRMEPTPESIAFADYFMENAVWDGVSTWSLILKPGMVYIDGVEIEWISKPGSADFVDNYASWAPSYDYDVGIYETKEFITYDRSYLSKGTFIVYNDD